MGNRYYLYGFIAVAVFTLLVACINYMNLATARAAKRAKEVGMRKILGSSRKALIAQFLAESVLLAVVAVRARRAAREARGRVHANRPAARQAARAQLHPNSRAVRLDARARAARRHRRRPLSCVLSLVDRARVVARGWRAAAARAARAPRGARVRAVHDLDRRDRLHARDGLADALHVHAVARFREGEPGHRPTARHRHDHEQRCDQDGAPAQPERARRVVGELDDGRQLPDQRRSDSRTTKA